MNGAARGHAAGLPKTPAGSRGSHPGAQMELGPVARLGGGKGPGRDPPHVALGLPDGSCAGWLCLFLLFSSYYFGCLTESPELTILYHRSSWRNEPFAINLTVSVGML